MVVSWLVLYSWVMFDSVHDRKCLLADGRVSPDSDLDGERLRLAIQLGEYL